jgi:hypothetical protein
MLRLHVDSIVIIGCIVGWYTYGTFIYRVVGLCVHESFLCVYVVRCKYRVRCSVFIFLFVFI